jgi:glycosyltransferase involved in cell wall biosynthesis
VREDILLLAPDLFGPPGGIARHARNLCEALARSEARLHSVVLHDPEEARADAGRELPGVAYSPCGGRRSLFVARAMAATRARPALVLVQHPHFSHLAWLVARVAGARLVVFGHGVEVWDRLRLLPRWALRRADLVVCPSRCTAERAAAANGVAAARIRVIPHSLPPSFAGTETHSRTLGDGPDDGSRNDLSLLSVGRLGADEGYKGQDTVIRALPILLHYHPRLVYDVVGDGDWRPELEALASDLEIADHVRFRGTVSDEELHHFYDAATVFVMPSRREGFGFVFLEAMAHSRPVIAGNDDAAAEVVREGETGFLVEPGSVRQVAERLRVLLGDAELRRRMGVEGARVVASEFGFDAFARRLAACLGDLTR